MVLGRALIFLGVLHEAAALSVIAAKASVTPVQKVIQLLKKLDAQIAADGKLEAEQYDKYSCFCKEQVDNKVYAIEQSEKQIADLDAKIQKLASDIKALNGEISELGLKITGLGTEIATQTSARKTEHESYVSKDTEVSDAIDAVQRAIEALKGSKGALSGHVEMEASALVQLRSVAVLGLGLAASTSTFTPVQLKTLAQLAKAGEPGDAYDYQYHSNDIIATLEGLNKLFKTNKKDLFEQEFEANSMFEKEVQALANEKKFAEADKLEKEKIEGYKTEVKEEATDDMSAETAAKDADGRFLSVVKQDCQDKATLFDERSQTRSGELTAISDAMKALTTGVAPNWKANRKLSGLQKGPAQVIHPGHWEYVEDAPVPASVGHAANFLQLRRAGHRGSKGTKADVQKKLLALLKGSASRLASSVLSITALKVEAAEDHFVKVRSIIKDLIGTLEAAADAEATSKSVCDKNMKAAVSLRDDEQAKIEDTEAQTSVKEADKAQLISDIAALSEEVAQNQKALLEATELRADEKKDNLMVIGQSEAGKEAVEFALETLQQFYESTELAQITYVPPNSDREGKTVSDLAPAVFNDRYQGKQSASKGIIGLLSVIMSDFERTDDKVSQDETYNAQEFVKYKKTTEDNIDALNVEKKKKEGEVVDIQSDLVTLEEALRAAQDLHGSALTELERLNPMCVAGEETYEERINKRHKEIESLKEAQNILEDWTN